MKTSLHISSCVLAVLALSYGNIVKREVDQPYPKEVSNECLDDSGQPISGIPYANPNDCKAYFQCSNGYRLEKQCVDGTVFNPALSSCDWPQNVQSCMTETTAIFDKSELTAFAGPAKAQEKIEGHTKTFDVPKVVKVVDGVYQAIGYALANMIMIEGPDGIVIVDTTESQAVAKNILQEFRKITDKPLKGIVMTHFHTDHTLGAVAIIEESINAGLVDGDINVYTHSTWEAQMETFYASISAGGRRSSRQFGNFLNDTEHENSGIGPFLAKEDPMKFAVPKPTHVFDEEMSFSLAGLNFQLFHTPGETDDHITVWLPDRKIMFPGDNIYKTFPNVYAIRGSPVRDANQWVKSLDLQRSLKAEHMVPSHTGAVSGADEIESLLMHYRDAIQYIHDQTVRWLNTGLGPDEIIQKIKLPSNLQTHDYLQEFYGTVAWSIRSVFQGYLGWFNGKPENLYPLTQAEHFQKLNRLLGSSSVLDDAERSVERSVNHLKDHDKHLIDELQWALELSAGVYAATDSSDPEHSRALEIEIDCLRKLAVSTFNPNGRNYYYTYSHELESNLDIGGDSGLTLANFMMQQNIDIIMQRLKYLLNAEACSENTGFTIAFNFPDISRKFSYKLRHCVFEYRIDGDIHDSADLTLHMASSVWRQLLAGKVGFLEAYMGGMLQPQGNFAVVNMFMGLITG